VVVITKNKKNYLPSVSGVLLRAVQRGTCVARSLCRQLRMWLDTAPLKPILHNNCRPILHNIFFKSCGIKFKKV